MSAMPSLEKLNNKESKTDRIQTALCENQMKYDWLLNSTSDMVFVHPISAQGLPAPFIEVNAAACKILGYPKVELQKLTLLDIFAEADLKTLPEEIERLKDQQVLSVEKTLIRKSGEPLPVEFNTRLFNKGGTQQYEYIMKSTGNDIRDVIFNKAIFRDNQGMVSGLIGTILDITDKKKTLHALQKSEERFLTVLNSIDADIYVSDMDTHEILFMNKKMIDAFGKDFTGQLCWQRLQNRPEPCPYCRNDDLKADSENSNRPIVWQDKNTDTGRHFIYYDRAIQWIDSRVVKIQIATDITHVKQMEAKLRQIQKMDAIGTLAGGIAHDFNNILSSIIGFTELAMDDAEKGTCFSVYLPVTEKQKTDYTGQSVKHDSKSP